jgi:hypothetical protein
MIAPAGVVRMGGKSGWDRRSFGGQGGRGGVDWLRVVVWVIGLGCDWREEGSPGSGD